MTYTKFSATSRAGGKQRVSSQNGFEGRADRSTPHADIAGKLIPPPDESADEDGAKPEQTISA